MTIELMDDVVWPLAWTALGVVLLVVAKLVIGFLLPFRVNEQLTSRDNPAVGLVVGAYLLGVLTIFVGAALGPEPINATPADRATDMAIAAGYTLGGGLGLIAGLFLIDKGVLRKFSIWKELIEDRNVGTAAILAGATLATSLIVAGAVHGQGGGWYSALAFFALGQVVFVVFAVIYQAVTRYDLHREVEKDNVAAGVSFGLTLLALGIVVLRGVQGDLVDWATNLTQFAMYAVGGSVLLIVAQKFGDVVLLPGTTLPLEIERDRNLNAAWIEGGFAVSVALLVYMMW